MSMTGLNARSRPWPEADRKAERKTGGARRDGSPDLHPPAGGFLLAGIAAVLPHLTSPAPLSPPTPRLVDDLRTALARTAALGETCRVATAADGVRLAANLLLAGSTDEARQALRHAQTALADASDTRRRPGS
jgi:hypothetical protein